MEQQQPTVRIEAIKLARAGENPGIKAYVDIVIGETLAIRGLKVTVDGDGRHILVFPARPHHSRCTSADCRRYGPSDSRYCPHCGTKVPRPDNSRFHEIVVPIDAEARSHLERLVFPAFLAFAGISRPEGTPWGVLMR